MIRVVGVSHRTAPLEVREALAFPDESLRDALQELLGTVGLSEAVILSTCNRVEVWGSSGDEPGSDALVEFLARHRGRRADQLQPYLYALEDEDAVRHAFKVAASLDSMVIGEPQILGQVKQAYQVAENAGSLGSQLGALRNRSLAAAKRARSETGIGKNAVSVSYVAVELARKIFGDLQGRRVLIVGAGKMSDLAARHLVASGARATVLGGRRFARAAELAASLGGEAAPFESLREQLGRADIVISSTGAPGTVIHREDVVAAADARKGRPLFLIDIAVPRDVDTAVREVPGTFLYDLDDLKSVAEANLRERRKQAGLAEAIVEAEVREFLGWLRSRQAVPLLTELREHAEVIRKGELERARRRLGDLTPEQERALDAMTSAIVNKMLHAPTVHLKESARNGQGPEHFRLIRKLLGF